MGKHRCDICGAEFNTPSEYQRHMKTSHPDRAPSAADLEHALSGIEYPAGVDALVSQAHDKGQEDIAAILKLLPNKNYRDAAEVARGFGELRSHETKPNDQPSVLGGAAAFESASASRFAALFEDLSFPASRDDLMAEAGGDANDEEIEIISKMPDQYYDDMAEVMRAFGEIKNGQNT